CSFDLCFQQKTRKLRGRCCPSFRILQPCQDARNVENDSGYGSWRGKVVLDGWRLSRGGIVNYIEELQQVIRELYGSDSTHVETVPVKEVFKGETMWDGEVEVFDLADHPKTDRVYAWGYVDDNDEK